MEDRATPLEECQDCFWQKGSELDLVEINPKSPPVEHAVLKILGDGRLPWEAKIRADYK